MKTTIQIFFCTGRSPRGLAEIGVVALVSRDLLGARAASGAQGAGAEERDDRRQDVEPREAEARLADPERHDDVEGGASDPDPRAQEGAEREAPLRVARDPERVDLQD